MSRTSDPSPCCGVRSTCCGLHMQEKTLDFRCTKCERVWTEAIDAQLKRAQRAHLRLVWSQPEVRSA